jgi:hypothetical protein
VGYQLSKCGVTILQSNVLETMFALIIRGVMSVTTAHYICTREWLSEPVSLSVSEPIGRVGRVRWSVITVCIAQPVQSRLLSIFLSFFLLLLLASIVVTMSLLKLLGHSQISVASFTLQSVSLPFWSIPWFP